MIAIDLKITDMPKLMSPESELIWDELVEDALDVLAETVVTETKQVAPVSFGHLRASIFSERPEGRAEKVRFVTSPLPYAIVMEEGRRPGARMPPIDPIRLWVRRVLRPAAADLENITFRVRRKIAELGIEALHFFAQAAQASEDTVRDLFEYQIEALVRRLEEPA